MTRFQEYVGLPRTGKRWSESVERNVADNYRRNFPIIANSGLSDEDICYANHVCEQNDNEVAELISEYLDWLSTQQF